MRILATLLIAVGLLTCSPPPEKFPEFICHNQVGITLGGNATAEVFLDGTGEVSLSFHSWTNGAVRVYAHGCDIFDSSTAGYADALAEGTEINPYWGAWEPDWVLIRSDVGPGAQFTNAGVRFLGFRVPASGPGQKHKYGWLRLDCSQGDTLLQIIDYAINLEPNTPIITGETDTGLKCTPAGLVQSVQDIIGTYRDNPDPGAECKMVIAESADPAYDFTIQYFPFMWPWPELPGKIVDGKLVIPYQQWFGNIPSPGGEDRPYEAYISGNGHMEISGQQVSLVWRIDYEKTGFMAESFADQFTMYKCN